MCQGSEELTQGTEMTSDSTNLFREYLVIESSLKFSLSSYFDELERVLKGKQR
jgi:hypothetical protein